MSLADAKVGDQLVWVAGFRRHRTIVTVTRVTATQIIVGTRNRVDRIRKRNGSVIGRKGYHCPTVRVPREGELDEIRAEERRSEGLRRIVDFFAYADERQHISIEDLDKIWEIISGYQKPDPDS